MTWWTAMTMLFATGLLGSLHCLGMCGPFALMAAARRPGWSGVAGYHAGRLMSYGLLGVIAGGVGAWVQSWHQWGPALVGGLAGLFTVLMGLSLLGVPLPVPAGWAQVVGRRLASLGPLGLGSCAGALPCGLLYGAIAQASLWGAGLGAGLLVAFWAGTVPALTFAGKGLQAIPFAWRGRFRHAAALSLIVLGIGVTGLRLAPHVGLPFCS